MDTSVDKVKKDFAPVPLPDKTISYDEISDENLVKKIDKSLVEIETRKAQCQKASDTFFNEDKNSVLEGLPLEVLIERLRYIFKNTLHSTGHAKYLVYLKNLAQRNSSELDIKDVLTKLEDANVCRDPRSLGLLTDVISNYEKFPYDDNGKQKLKGLILYSLIRLLGKDSRSINLVFVLGKLNRLSSIGLIDEANQKEIEHIGTRIRQEYNSFKSKVGNESATNKVLDIIHDHISVNENLMNDLVKIMQMELDKVEASV